MPAELVRGRISPPPPTKKQKHTRRWSISVRGRSFCTVCSPMFFQSGPKSDETAIIWPNAGRRCPKLGRVLSNSCQPRSKWTKYCPVPIKFGSLLAKLRSLLLLDRLRPDFGRHRLSLRKYRLTSGATFVGHQAWARCRWNHMFARSYTCSLHIEQSSLQKLGGTHLSEHSPGRPDACRFRPMFAQIYQIWAKKLRLFSAEIGRCLPIAGRVRSNVGQSWWSHACSYIVARTRSGSSHIESNSALGIGGLLGPSRDVFLLAHLFGSAYAVRFIRGRDPLWWRTSQEVGGSD